MKQYILALVLAVVSASVAFAVNPIKEGNMISGHVIVKGTEENIPYATVLIIGSGQGTVSNEEGQFELLRHLFKHILHILIISHINTSDNNMRIYIFL